jgi:murein DD-endopeptidase MepM/ murein hydrolase activator NlpD
VACIVALPLLASATAPEAKERQFIMPPKAVPGDVIHEVTLSPIYAEYFMCSEHYAGQLAYAGDALGTDCMIVAGIRNNRGFMSPFRTDGRSNQDWYGFHAQVLSPADGKVVGVLAKEEVNTPGTMGKPPAAGVQIRRADGVIIALAHLEDIRIRRGDMVKAGQVLGLVGNNGMARNPHIHVGAWREAINEPLQIRWDLKAMARFHSNDE